MRKFSLVVLLVVFFIGTKTNAQLKIGATFFPQLTMTNSIIPFKKDVKNNHNLPTPTAGGGLVFTYDSYRKPLGASLGISYSSHNQTYVYTYKLFDEEHTHRGKKRFDYLKFSLVARKFGYVHKYVKSVFYIGPQFSYLLKYDGGAVYYIENIYFDLPQTKGYQYYKKYSIDAVIGYSLDYAIHKNFDVFAGLRLDYGLNNVENKNLIVNGAKIFDNGGAHQMALSLQLGAYYVFHRKDHLLLPGNTWRYRVYKKKKYSKGRN